MSARALLERMRRGEAVIVPGVHDALTAKLAERAGFSAVFVSGYGLSASLLGEPDLGFVEMGRVLDAAERVVSATSLPVFVDADTGYGDAFHVERVVEALIARDFAITARTDARAVHGLDEAIRRAKLYAEAGADLVFVEAPQSALEMRAIREAVPEEVVLVANMVEGGKTPMRPAKELAEDGYGFVLFPVSGLLSAVRAMERTFEVLAREGTTAGAAETMRTFAELNEITGLPEFYAREKAWLR